jgi:hypothetical protein
MEAHDVSTLVNSPENDTVEALANSKKKKYIGTIVHDLRRCAARNLSRAGVDRRPQDPEHVSALSDR